MRLYSTSCVKSHMALLFTIILQSLLFPHQATASPFPVLLGDLFKRYSGNIVQQTPPGGYPGSPSTSNFPTDGQINSDFIQPSQNSYVFYSEITHPAGSQRAYDFAREIGAVAIGSAFPDQYM